METLPRKMFDMQKFTRYIREFDQSYASLWERNLNSELNYKECHLK